MPSPCCRVDGISIGADGSIPAEGRPFLVGPACLLRTNEKGGWSGPRSSSESSPPLTRPEGEALGKCKFEIEVILVCDLVS
ncbi:hypothetical protein MPTK1_3g02420 [Marchantia polymorpha subsp. ruderalis]|uniref:Uncharacterized protein n=2 Tax=Marchantia polymorpha TaxID=3197 RepID=A0AAF6AWP6_MARPO|nr:hypothetical protein MARPO_0007s0231 [Marchantia polymorpha]BBN04180.1 hypothetical protein Mp_3g02420 [Marchantia polymorpha subsp. ruderalis]|eukprot:PTQ47867.1 hypothetical protein MARPO_0007s0231 [Marchantia polymorpha]